MEEELECCGVRGPRDYPKGQIPLSCYDDFILFYVVSGISNKRGKYIISWFIIEWLLYFYFQGCGRALSDQVKAYAIFLPVTVIILSILEIFAVSGACCLGRDIKKNGRPQIVAWIAEQPINFIYVILFLL